MRSILNMSVYPVNPSAKGLEYRLSSLLSFTKVLARASKGAVGLSPVNFLCKSHHDSLESALRITGAACFTKTLLTLAAALDPVLAAIATLLAGLCSRIS